MPKIVLNKITTSYIDEKKKKEYTVFCDLSAEFSSNKKNVIIGSSGCGKTTLLKCISGLMGYDGEIYFDDLCVDDVNVEDRNIGFIRQEYVLYNHLSVFNNIAFPLKVSGCSSDEIRRRVFDIAKKLEIEQCLTRKPRQISNGQCQRVALARALIKNPSILLADEPFSNVDPLIKTTLIKLLNDVCDELEITVIYVTHSIKEAMVFADYIYVMDNGEFITKGTPDEVYKSSNTIVKSLMKSDELENE